MSVQDSLKITTRRALRLAREVPLYGGMVLPGRNLPLAVFLPAYGPEGAALLRIYRLARALRPLGWRTLVLPWRLSLAQRRRVLRAAGPDVVVMQGARHALNRPAFYPEWPIIYDMDDADFHLDHLADPVREAMGQVAGVVAGSAYVADWCKGAGAPTAEVVWTGSAVSPGPRVPHRERPPVVAWAQTAPETYAGEADMVAKVMAGLRARRPEVRLRLYDRRPESDPGFSARFGPETEWLGPLGYRDYLRSFDDVSVGLAPLMTAAPFVRGKSFGKVLGYLDRHVPVLASDACEHGAFFDDTTGVVSNDPEVWIPALDRLLGDAGARQRMAEAAFQKFEARLTLDEAARRVDGVLRAVLV